MYFWKTEDLAISLKNDELSESNYKNYYIATSVILLVGFYIVSLEPPKTSSAVIFEAIGTILSTVVALNIIFKRNGGDSGQNFLNRVVCLSFPLSIKVMAISVLAGIVLEMARISAGIGQAQIDWLYSVYSIIVQIVFFWRIAVHVRIINT